MAGKVKLSLEQVREVSAGMPGGFFIYIADEKEELIYFNDVVLSIYGCRTKEEFLTLTGGTFRGMVYPDDYEKVDESIIEQVIRDEDRFDHVEYRIIRKDGMQ